MLILILLLLQCCLPLLVLGSADSEELSIYPIIMPMIVPAKNEVYLCTSVDLSQTNKTYWIKGFEPKVKNPRIHHMVRERYNCKFYIYLYLYIFIAVVISIFNRKTSKYPIQHLELWRKWKTRQRSKLSQFWSFGSHWRRRYYHLLVGHGR